MTGIFLWTQKGDMKFSVLFHITFLYHSMQEKLPVADSMYKYSIVRILQTIFSDTPCL